MSNLDYMTAHSYRVADTLGMTLEVAKDGSVTTSSTLELTLDGFCLEVSPTILYGRYSGTTGYTLFAHIGGDLHLYLHYPESTTKTLLIIDGSKLPDLILKDLEATTTVKQAYDCVVGASVARFLRKSLCDWVEES